MSVTEFECFVFTVLFFKGMDWQLAKELTTICEIVC